MQNIQDTLFSFAKSIAPYIIGLFSGLLIEHHRMEKSSIREKAKQLNDKEIVLLKDSINTTKTFFDENNYITFDRRKFDLRYSENHFLDKIAPFSIFNVENGMIALSYKRDKILNKHMKPILQSLNEYHTNISNINRILAELENLGIPYEFEENIIKLVINQFGSDILSTESRRDEFIWILYITAMTGSYNSYKSGRVNVIKLIENRFFDLQNIVINIPQCLIKYKKIKENVQSINENLQIANDEIQVLKDDWQNKLMI